MLVNGVGRVRFMKTSEPPLAVEGEHDARQGINSVEVGVAVIEAVASIGRPATLTELARALDTQPSRLHRYLVSLSRVGLLARDLRGAYEFGPAMRRLGAEAIRRTNEIAVASEYAPMLRDRTGHSVNVAVWADRGPTICRWDFGAYPLPIIPRTGSILPLLSTSVGRMFLALLPERMTREFVEAELAGAADIVDARRIVEERRVVDRERGWSSSIGAVVPDLTTFSAGTVNTGRQLPVVITVACAAGTIVTEADRDAVVSELLQTVEAIAQDLGG